MSSIQEWVQSLESTTINETLKELFFWGKVKEHLPTTGILKPLYADSLTFTGWSGLGDIFSKLSTKMNITLSIRILQYWILNIE